MTRLRFALLNAAHDGANTRRNFRRELDADLVEFDATGGHLPADTDFDGVVVTGSRSSVYWDEEWIPPLVDYVAEAADAGLPVLGVCYGHQVLAEALGGRVAGMDEFEIGYNVVRRRGDDELFDGIDEEFMAFTTHGDAVVELPPTATLLAENDHGVHAFRDGHCWGVQFHPEYDVDTAREVTEGKRERLGDARVDAVLEEITSEAHDAACEVKGLFDNFAEYAQRLRADRTSRAAADD
ncbi:type 1 glutamine amidotransferase [Halorubrum yunnanense]|uniref:Type 1 glutamine amidotransferase n=1 Tax=Halorubrum yunnanense TaxID=1526162 RepID=A0ABD5YFB4_9EURY|nr:type 1 glutamine amidotransferase [Halorubrum yunnanense]